MSQATNQQEFDRASQVLVGGVNSAVRAFRAVGGGIGTPERAADFLPGDWSVRSGRPPMTVDGVLVGPAALTTM